MTSAAFHVQQARRHLETGNAVQALVDAEQGLAVHPHDAELQLAAAQSLMALDRPAEAAARLEALTAASPDLGEGWMRLGACRLRLGEVAAAIMPLEQGLMRMPNAFLARLQLAECLQATGRADEALAQYFRAVTTAQMKGRWRNDQTTAPDLRDRVRAAMGIIDAGRRALFFSAIDPLQQQYGEGELRRITLALEGYLGLRPSGSPDPRQKPTFL